MEAADIQKAAGQKLKAAREALGRSPALALLAAVAAGFVGGLVLRYFEKPRRQEKAAGE